MTNETKMYLSLSKIYFIINAARVRITCGVFSHFCDNTMASFLPLLGNTFNFLTFSKTFSAKF